MKRNRTETSTRKLNRMAGMGFSQMIGAIVSDAQAPIKIALEKAVKNLSENSTPEEQKLFLEFVENTAIPIVFNPSGHGRKVQSPFRKFEENKELQKKILPKHISAWKQAISVLEYDLENSHKKVANALAPGYKENKKDIVSYTREELDPVVDSIISKVTDRYKLSFTEKQKNIIKNLAWDNKGFIDLGNLSEVQKHQKKIDHELNNKEFKKIPKEAITEIWKTVDSITTHVDPVKFPILPEMLSIFGTEVDVIRAIELFSKMPLEDHQELCKKSFKSLEEFAQVSLAEIRNNLPECKEKVEEVAPPIEQKKSNSDKENNFSPVTSSHSAPNKTKQNNITKERPKAPISNADLVISYLMDSKYHDSNGASHSLFPSGNEIKLLSDKDKKQLIDEQKQTIQNAKLKGREFISGGSHIDPLSGITTYIWYHPDHLKEGKDRDANKIIYKVKPDGTTDVLFGNSVSNSLVISEANEKQGIGSKIMSINQGKVTIIGDENNKQLNKSEAIDKSFVHQITRDRGPLQR